MTSFNLDLRRVDPANYKDVLLELSRALEEDQFPNLKVLRVNGGTAYSDGRLDLMMQRLTEAIER